MNQNNTTSVPIELLRKYDRPGPRYTSYPTAPVWSSDITTDDYRQALMAASTDKDKPLALYCHIPFCECRCYYCGCNTVITRNSDRVQLYVDLLKTEIEQSAELLNKRNKVSQLHFGGGTPTYLSIEQMADIFDKIDEHFVFTDDYEKSLEIDPRVTTFEQLEFLVSRGFNRISLGVQDFNNDVQQAIGRIQSYELVKQKMDECRQLKFKGVNIDLIYGLPKQTLETFKKTIDDAIKLRPDRVALYSFAYLPKQRANQMNIKEEDLPSTEVKYSLFAYAVEAFTAAGYLQIGMDHFALPDDELSLALHDGRLHRNFMGYTVQTSPDMLGLGMSSIGYINNSFFQNYSKIDSYMDALNGGNFAVYRGMILNDDDLIRQYVITQLMCNFRMNFDNFKKKFKTAYHDYFKDEHKNLAEFYEDNLMDTPTNELKITPIGRTFIRNIAMTFDAYLGKEGQGEKPTYSRTI